MARPGIIKSELNTRELSKVAKLANMLAIGHGAPERSESWALDQIEAMTGEPVYWEWVLAAFSDTLDALGYGDNLDDLLDLDPEDVESEICQEAGITQDQLDQALCLEVLKDDPVAEEGEIDSIRQAAKVLFAELYAEKDARLAELTPDEYHRIAGVIHPYYSEAELHGAPIADNELPAGETVTDLNMGDYSEKLANYDLERLCEALVAQLPEAARHYQINADFVFAGYENFQFWLDVKREGIRPTRKPQGSFDGLDDAAEL